MVPMAIQDPGLFKCLITAAQSLYERRLGLGRVWPRSVASSGGSAASRPSGRPLGNVVLRGWSSSDEVSRREGRRLSGDEPWKGGLYGSRRKKNTACPGMNP